MATFARRRRSGTYLRLAGREGGCPKGSPRPCPSSASVGMTDYSQVDSLTSPVQIRQLKSGEEPRVTKMGETCEDRIGTGPPRARTDVIYVDSGSWAISGSIRPKGDPASWGINSYQWSEDNLTETDLALAGREGANHSTEMCSGSEAGSYLRLIGSCITQLKAQGPSRSCNESKEEEEDLALAGREGAFTKGAPRPCPSSASVGVADYSQVDSLNSRYTSVNFGAEKSPVSPK